MKNNDLQTLKKQPPKYRVQKLLSNYGFCSRRKAEKLIEQGRVKVNKTTITIGDKASEDDIITVDNKIVQKEKKVYLKFNKPLDCVTALRDKKYKTVMDYININERVFPIGRLDYNTSGLLLLTNDGDFANKIMHPSNEINKTYLVELDKYFEKEIKNIIENGIIIDNRKTYGKIKIISKKLVEIEIHEGRNRIVRRIFGKLKYKVISLKRISIGKLNLGNLKTGKYKQLNSDEISKIFK